MNPWFEVSNAAEVPSPSLLVYPDRIEENIRRMVAMVNGDAARLRPHMKTHKMPEVITLHLKHGITKFKCATIAEAEMTAGAGAPEVLLAYPPVGPNIGRLRRADQEISADEVRRGGRQRGLRPGALAGRGRRRTGH